MGACSYGFALDLSSCECKGPATCEAYTLCSAEEYFDLFSCQCEAKEGACNLVDCFEAGYVFSDKTCSCVSFKTAKDIDVAYHSGKVHKHGFE